MIIYSKSLWALPLLLRWYGSALPRALPAALISGAFAAVLSAVAQQELQEAWLHPYPYNAFAVIVSFILVFRGNHAWARFWEGCSNSQLMGARWADAALMLLTWDTYTLPPEPTEDECAAAQQFAAALLHLLSLLHGLACQALRRDALLANLRPHNSMETAPPTDPANLHSTSRPPHDNGVGQISWTDLFLLRGTPSNIARYNAAQPLPVIGGVSGDEWRALACEQAPWPRAPGSSKQGKHQRHKFFAASVDAACCMWHVPYMERPQIVMTWLHQLLVQRQRAGGLDVPPPILTRAYQELSDGMVAYQQCRKVASIPFPFAWAQFVLVLLIAFTFMLPVMVVAYVPNMPLAVVLSVLTVSTYWAMNEVARDIEDPFMYEPNELALATMQYNYNDVLLAVSTTRRPLSVPEELLARGRDADVHGTASSTNSVLLQMPAAMQPPGVPSPAARVCKEQQLGAQSVPECASGNGWSALDVQARTPRDAAK